MPILPHMLSWPGASLHTLHLKLILKLYECPYHTLKGGESKNKERNQRTYL